MLYTHSALDRADHLRKDDAALAEMRHAASTRLHPVWRGNLLVASPGKSEGDVPIPTGLASLAHDVAVPNDDMIFLGQVNGAAQFAVSVDALDDEARAALATQAPTPDGKAQHATFEDLRVVGAALPADDAALLAYARGLIFWQKNARFCERCGGPMHSENGGHVRRCDHPDGGHVTFPRTDAAVIMLVTHEPTDGSAPLCLLGRAAAWPSGVFSTLAGFVEPGESLEQAVSREVYEESGILTTDVHYVASQPWPFPRSIMLGFEARATTTDITIDPEELDDARWFTAEQIASFGNWGDPGDNLQLPRVDSIARFLIDRWMAEHR